MKRKLILAFIFLLGVVLTIAFYSLFSSKQHISTQQVQFLEQDKQVVENQNTKVDANASTTKQNNNAIAKDPTNSPAYKTLKTMLDNLKELSYTLEFSISENDVKTYYTYVNINQDGKRSEYLKPNDTSDYIIQKDGFISYNNYSIKANSITDVLPNIFNLDLKVVAQNYNFTVIDKASINGHTGIVIDITNKYSNLYSYQVVVDEETLIPIKVYLIEKDLVSKSFTVLNEYTAEKIELGINKKVLSKVNKTKFNKEVVLRSQVDPKITEEFNDIVYIPLLPAGFKLISNSEVTLYGNQLINSNVSDQSTSVDYNAMTYFDGLFNFTIYVSKKEVDTQDHYYWNFQENTLYCEDYAGRKIIMVSQLPLVLTKAIVSSIKILKDGEPVDAKHPSGFGQKIALGADTDNQNTNKTEK